MVSALLSRCLILILGTLYPAYRSYKAIKNKDLREHVKWMMYWIVFALFTTLETFLDVFVSWFPFYYEIKIIFILWVLSPATRGSSILYKKIVHPMLTSREQEIDELIEKTKVQGYSTFLQLFTSGFNYASNLFMNSAMRGQTLLGAQLKSSLSLDEGYEQSTSKKNLKTSKSNDVYFMQRQGIEDEDSDFDQEIVPRQSSKITKKSKSSYEMIDDDEILIAEQAEKQRKVTKRRVAKPPPDQGTTYKSSETSHYGTITRGKISKNRSQLTNSNESDQ